MKTDRREVERRAADDQPRTMPHSLDAERAVLGAAMCFPDSLKLVIDELSTDDFFRDAHRKIYRQILELNEDGAAIDLLTVKEALLAAGELGDVGGPAYLASLTDGIPKASNAGQYAAIVIEKARLRRTIHTATKLLNKAFDGGETASKLAGESAEQLLSMADSDELVGPISAADILPSTIDAINAAHLAKGGVTGVASGITKLDEMTCGLQPGELTLIAARTSIGKTSLVMNIARRISLDEYVLGFSLEMSKEQLLMRLIGSEARVDSNLIRAGALTDADWVRVGPALVTLGKLKLYIDDSASMAIGQMRARARAFVAKYGSLKLIFVDYIQLMQGSGKFENRTQELGTISRGLKRLAKELKVPVVALAQLSRKPEQRQNTRPQLSDLRESGDLEQDADMVWLIFRQDPKPEDDPSNVAAEIIIGKQRNGPVGVVKVRWRPEFTTFENSW